MKVKASFVQHQKIMSLREFVVEDDGDDLTYTPEDDSDDEQGKEEEKKKRKKPTLCGDVVLEKQKQLCSVPSCGLTLLKAPQDCFDYVLHITSDDQMIVNVFCHRCVLLAHSGKMRELISGENFFDMSVRVKPGYVSSTVELVQYMYLKDIEVISDKDKVLELSAFFEMPMDHYLIREETLKPLDLHRVVAHLTIVPDNSSILAIPDFLKHLRFEKAALESRASNPTCSLSSSSHSSSSHSLKDSNPPVSLVEVAVQTETPPPKRKRRATSPLTKPKPRPKRYNLRNRS